MKGEKLGFLKTNLIVFSVFLLLLSFILHVAIPLPSPWIKATWHGITYSFNEDSPEFVRGVVDFPNRAFFEGNIRIARPLYIFMGWLVYKLFKISGAEKLIPSDLERLCSEFMQRAFTRADMWLSNYSPKDIILAWVSLIIVSAFLFLISFLVISSLFIEFAMDVKTAMALVLILFIEARLSLEGLVWSPHTEVFDILIPALSSYFCFRSYNEGGSKYLLYCLIMGILMLGKGELFGVIVVVLFPYLTGRTTIRKALTGLLLGILPTLSYILFLKLFGYECFVYEVETYKQGVWFFDVWRKGGLLLLFKELLLKIKEILENALVSLRLGFGVLFAFSMLAHGGGRLHMKENEFLYKFGLIYCFFAFTFWLWVGFVPSRLMLTFYPPLYLLLCVQLGKGVSPFKRNEALHSDSRL